MTIHRTASLWLAVAALAGATSARAAELAVETDFPGGSGVAEVDRKTNTVRLDPADHPGKGWRCWWYARLVGLTPGEAITLDVGEAPWATPKRAALSTDGGETWQQSEEGVAEGKRMRYTLAFDTETALVAWGPPFVPSDAGALVRELSEDSPDAESFVLCRTREGRDTPALRIGRTAGREGGADRPLVWVHARQHAWESGSSWVGKGFAEWAVSDAPAAVRLRERCEIVFVPIMDVDNAHRGAGGKNQEPQDHNRDWTDAPHWNAVAAAQKELRAAAEADRLAAYVDLHNPGAGSLFPYFYITPRELLGEPAADNLDRFLLLAKEEITGPLRFTGQTIASGQDYDPKAWTAISKNWVARLGTPAIAVTLETAWNAPASHTEGYLAVGRQLGKTLARYIEAGL
ncbi:MAG: M14 family zinc carboxypeptidase [Verrucomicrobiales bacterium]